MFLIAISKSFYITLRSLRAQRLYFFLQNHPKMGGKLWKKTIFTII